ncbi:Uncharacterised protein [Mycobacteroides abscessus subsp. massiliense]|nr:Uncharacterised protein [Mycobacteroides abscessus subsp. massiliense]
MASFSAATKVASASARSVKAATFGMPAFSANGLRQSWNWTLPRPLAGP